MMSKVSGRYMPLSDHIRQSIADILFTRIGSRVQREEYGSLLPDLIDQPFNEANQLRICASVYMALAAWEPRVTVSNVTVANQTDGNTGAAITIEADVNGNAETFILD